MGLSPHGRGKRSRTLSWRTPVRSIPARAGETGAATRYNERYWVYPRPCGGNSSTSSEERVCWGLSPPVRGKRSSRPSRPPRTRSIPARAGETGRAELTMSRHWVYPRTGGGNYVATQGDIFVEGLSPHGRGKQVRTIETRKGMRSIPARAGETRKRSSSFSAMTVYPRTGGGNGQCPSAIP